MHAQEGELKSLLDKLRADAKKSKARLTKIEEEAAVIKFPVKDELLKELIHQSSSDKTAVKNGSTASSASKLEPIKELPPAVLQLNAVLPEHLVGEAIGVWDFLNVFR